MRTRFEDLVFTEHKFSDMLMFSYGEQAWVEFANGWSVSIIKGFDLPYKVYECEVFKRGEISDYVKGYRRHIDHLKCGLSEMSSDKVCKLIDDVANFKPCFYKLSSLKTFLIRKPNILLYPHEITMIRGYKRNVIKSKKERESYWKAFRRRNAK